MSTKRNSIPTNETETQSERIRQLVSRKQVSQMGGCCIETLKRWERRGILKPIKLSPRMIRYDLREVQEAFANARVEHVQSTPVAAAA